MLPGDSPRAVQLLSTDVNAYANTIPREDKWSYTLDSSDFCKVSTSVMHYFYLIKINYSSLEYALENVVINQLRLHFTHARKAPSIFT